MTNPIPSYIQIPPSGQVINEPTDFSSPIQAQALPRPSVSARPSFPPAASDTQAPPSRKFNVPTSALSTNVSDLLLSSLLPPNLPKLPASTGRGEGSGRVRELSTQREALSLPLVSNNFRRFVTKVGPLFWVQDRIEEVLFWRKPTWTYAYMLAWGFISFYPRLLLLLPSITLLLVILYNHERNKPLPSLIGTGAVPLPPAAGTVRITQSSGQEYTSSKVDGEGSVPVVPPKEAESGVDYYLNVQAIQNLMGIVSDAYDYLAPRLTVLNKPTNSSTSFPVTTTHLVLVLLPSLLLPLLPGWAISYLILALGLAPPLFFHPNLKPLALPRHPALLKLRSKLERLVVIDSLEDTMGRKEISQVEVWENERLDPTVAAKPISASTPAVWGSRFLRAGERAPWVKVYGEGSKWKALGEGQKSLAGDKEESSEVILALEADWAFLPTEGWKVDTCGLWSVSGSDYDGWVYTDDSWQNPSLLPVVETDAPMGPQRKVTRRRRWHRPVYRDEPVSIH